MNVKTKNRFSLDKITFAYHSTGNPVFTDLSLTIEEGSALFLLGPNGTGKSTLLKCLAGLLVPQTGAIYLDDKPIAHLGPGELAKKIAYVPQSQVSPFPFLVREIVLMGRAAHLSPFSLPGRKDEAIMEDALQRVGVSDLADRRSEDLSGGEWQLVLIARALAQGTDILLLDEPTSHLDLGNQMKVLDVVGDLTREGITIITATHFPDHALLHASEVVLLKGAKILNRGVPKTVLTPENLETAYGVEVHVVELSEPVNRRVCVPVSGRKEKAT